MPRVIPRFRLDVVPLEDAAEKEQGFRWADPEIGRRHRLGGIPENPVGFPNCPSCSQEMTFYAQLDSIGDNISIADVGLIYVFLCFECVTAEAVVDSG